jgi:DNA-binding LacI/PurR family transcriptional regulator
MPRQKLTNKEIAKMAGVSPTAVSFYLNNRNGIGAATKENIRKAIEETNFHPNAAARRLRLNKTFNVALLYSAAASPFSDLFYYEVASGLTEELTRNHYNVVYVPFEYDGDNCILPDIISRDDADGAVILQHAPPAMLSDMDAHEIPFVLIDWQSEAHDRIVVSFDCERAIYRAVMYLVEKGHQNIAFWGSDALPNYYLQCFTGYQNALLDSQLSISPGWLVKDIYDYDSAFANIEKFSSMRNRPTAVCCMSDMCAIHCIQASTRAGISVPDDLSFISIDDIILSRYIHPQLTTVSYKKDKIGEVAAMRLMKVMAGKDTASLVVNCEDIMERESVKDLL